MYMISRTGVPQQFFNNENLKIGQKFTAFWLITLGANGSNFANVVHVTCHEAGLKIRVQIFGSLQPRNLVGQKHAKFGTILDDFRL